MTHQVVWTKRVTDFFVEKGNLTSVEIQILESRISGMTRLQQSHYYNMSIRTVDNIIARLKTKYDEVQQEYPDVLKPRRISVYERVMDGDIIPSNVVDDIPANQT